MKVTLLTTTCDRPEAFKLCELWISRQTVKPVQWLVLDDGEKPVTTTQGQEHHHWPDMRGHGSMVKKIKFALQAGLIIGDAVIFIEDDDWYAPDWIQWCVQQLQHYDLVGECENLY